MIFGNTKRFVLRISAITLAILMLVGAGSARPVQAETAGQASTRNLILAGTALAVGIILYNNYHHKQVAHDTVVGRTADGGTVFADGHVAYPNGAIVYTSNDGRNICTFNGVGVPCGRTIRVYRPRECDEEDRDREHHRHRDKDEHHCYRGNGLGHHYGVGHDDNQGNE